MKLVLHIGAHKTGTTAIQTVATTEQLSLAHHGIWYPVGMYEKVPEQHSGMYYEVEHHDADLAPLRTRLIGAIDAAKAAGCHTLFLSGEDICAAAEAQVVRLLKAMDGLFESTTVWLVLRNQREYFGSHYNHTLKYGPQIFLSDMPRHVQFSPSRTVSLWRQLLGHNAVHVLPYAGEDPLVTRFFQTLFGYTVSDPKAYEGVNPSIDIVAAFFLNAVLKCEPDFDPDRFMAVYFEVFGKEKFSFPISDIIAEQVVALYPHSEWIVDGVDFAPPATKKTKSPNTEELIRYIELLSITLEKYKNSLQVK